VGINSAFKGFKDHSIPLRGGVAKHETKCYYIHFFLSSLHLPCSVLNESTAVWTLCGTGNVYLFSSVRNMCENNICKQVQTLASIMSKYSHVLFLGGGGA
jgi:hypothetical protein